MLHVIPIIRGEYYNNMLWTRAIDALAHHRYTYVDLLALQVPKYAGSEPLNFSGELSISFVLFLTTLYLNFNVIWLNT